MSRNTEPHTEHSDITKPYTYICGLPAKIKCIIRMLHNASLIIDDIEDGSKLRRGSPVAHSLFGVASTINAGNYIYFQALSLTLALDKEPRPPSSPPTDCIGVFTSELLNLHRGQGQDIVWRDESTCPTLPQYESMVLDKTGGLFRLAVGLMVQFRHPGSGGGGGDFGRLVELLALYFQIRDDLINLASLDYFKEKGYCEDLVEGKYSYPIIHCLGTPSGDIVRNVLKRRTADRDVLGYARSVMLKEGSFRFTYARCEELKGDIVGEIEGRGGHEGLKGLVELLHRQVRKVGEEVNDKPKLERIDST
ncbi:hypothetical protein TrRE_jg8829 [Triparma retinervis]|uniref:Geranylgeranyl diphosphate synthase n=1 Tax=Triparma retinervis TaxID=2557542 RepID=A0A9W7DMC2_9STRA|nr:hypothetical protein TrRE_jg8829 [Triparma retinervis]